MNYIIKNRGKVIMASGIILNRNLSDGEFRLYAYLTSIKNRRDMGENRVKESYIKKFVQKTEYTRDCVEKMLNNLYKEGYLTKAENNGIDIEFLNIITKQLLFFDQLEVIDGAESVLFRSIIHRICKVAGMHNIDLKLFLEYDIEADSEPSLEIIYMIHNIYSNLSINKEGLGNAIIQIRRFCRDNEIDLKNLEEVLQKNDQL